MSHADTAVNFKLTLWNVMYIEYLCIYELNFKSLCTVCNLWTIANCPLTKSRFWHLTNPKKLAFNFSQENLGADFSEISEFQMDISYRQILFLLYFMHKNLNFKISINCFSRPSFSRYEGCYVFITGIGISLERSQNLTENFCFHWIDL